MCLCVCLFFTSDRTFHTAAVYLRCLLVVVRLLRVQCAIYRRFSERITLLVSSFVHTFKFASQVILCIISFPFCFDCTVFWYTSNARPHTHTLISTPPTTTTTTSCCCTYVCQLARQRSTSIANNKNRFFFCCFVK